jgi:hypothetical protein
MEASSNATRKRPERFHRLDFLTPSTLLVIVACMFRRVVACLVLGMWLGLLGVEFSEELGLFIFTNEDTDQAADDALGSLGQAISAPDQPYFAIAKHWLSKIAVYPLSGSAFAYKPLALSSQYNLAATVPKHYIPIYKLYLDFRI